MSWCWLCWVHVLRYAAYFLELWIRIFSYLRKVFLNYNFSVCSVSLALSLIQGLLLFPCWLFFVCFRYIFTFPWIILVFLLNFCLKILLLFHFVCPLRVFFFIMSIYSCSLYFSLHCRIFFLKFLIFVWSCVWVFYCWFLFFHALYHFVNVL